MFSTWGAYFQLGRAAKQGVDLVFEGICLGVPHGIASVGGQAKLRHEEENECELAFLYFKSRSI